MSKAKVKIIDNTQDMECYGCLGGGKVGKRTCPTCHGNGIWKEEHYYLVVPEQKIAFDIDNLGK